jgi:hypothetical protein
MPNPFKLTDAGASKWADLRRIGRRRFILRHGLTWAALTWGLLTVWQAATEGTDQFDLAWFVIHAVVWTVCGLAYGAFLWHASSMPSAAAHLSKATPSAARPRPSARRLLP